jgi:2-methylcitrate dehydratase PrpD
MSGRLTPARREILKAAATGAALAAGFAGRGRAQEHAAEDGGSRSTASDISPLMRTVTRYMAEARDRALPDAIAESGKHHLIDSVAAMISGSKLLAGQEAAAYVRELGGAPQACVPGTDIVTNVVNAALAGGMMAHADETDDSHEPSLTHPGCAIVPATLAMAERTGASGTALLRAVVLGYDICTRMSKALGSYKFFAAGHSTHAYGPTFGTAAACGSLAGLDADRMRHMLSFASQQASGISYQQRDVQHVEKSFDLGGMPGRNGATAATMVASGMTAVEDAFSGERNFFFAHKSFAQPEELTRDLGHIFEVVNTSIKKWSVGSPAQAPLDSIYELLHQSLFKADDVAHMTIRLSHQGANVVNNRNVPDICMQHLAAIMVLDRGATFAAVHDHDRMHHPKVLELRARIELLGDDDLDRVMPSRQGIVEIALRDGRTLRHHTKDLRGSPENPMDRGEIDEKCVPLIAMALGEKRAKALVEAMWALDDVRNVRELRPLLVA